MEDIKIDGRTREAKALRPPLRSEDPRRDAAERAKQILEHVGQFGEQAGDFDFDQSIVPEGWSYEWKELTVMGMTNASRQIELARFGWEPVPTSRHPEMMPAGSTERSIIRKGLQLMERPAEVTEIAKKQELRAAQMQMRSKKEQLEGAPVGAFEGHNNGKSLAKIKTDYNYAMKVPD